MRIQKLRDKMVNWYKCGGWAATILVLVLTATACGSATFGGEQELDDAQTAAAGALQPVSLSQNEKLRIVATTSIVADVVANVGSDAIDLTSLMPVGADPHSFTPTPQDMRTLNDAHVIFVNGLGLEESLVQILQNLDREVALVSVNEDVETISLADSYGHGDEHHDEPAGDEDASGGEEAETDEANEERGADPHTWFSVPNVMIWTDNIAETLAALDPARADLYDANAGSYRDQLAQLDADVREMVGTLPEERRKLVTDHVALGYLAAEYGFETVGSVLPSLSTLASASAQELSSLQQAMDAADVPVLFVSVTVNPQTAEQLANDLEIPVVELYIGSLSDRDGPAGTYMELMRFDVEQIVEALK